MSGWCQQKKLKLTCIFKIYKEVSLMEDKLKDEIKAAVTSIFSEKEEADMRKKTENALQKSAETIQELTVSLESKNEELEQKDEKLAEAEENTQTLQTELEAAKQEVVDVTEKLTASEKSLEEINKDIAAEKRMTELKTAKVSDSEEGSQLERVREMTDEEFDSYKNERVTLRESVVAEIEAARVKEESSETDDEAAAAAAAAAEAASDAASEEEGEASEEELEEGTLPANIDPGQAVSAALNMEIIPSKDVMTKYAELGKAMAENMNKSK